MLSQAFQNVTRGNDKRSKLIQQLIDQYFESSQGQERLSGIVRGSSGTGVLGVAGGGLSRFSRAPIPRITWPSQIPQGIRDSLGPGGAGIPGAQDISSGFGEGVPDWEPDAGADFSDAGEPIPDDGGGWAPELPSANGPDGYVPLPEPQRDYGSGWYYDPETMLFKRR